MSYLSTVYSQSARPKSSYPGELALYIKEQFKLRDGMSILDIACGRGDFAEAFAKVGLEAHAIDWEKAEQFPTSVAFTLGDVSKKMPYADNTFDVVFSKSVIEHMQDPEAFIKENLRILKPGGRLICLVPDWMSGMYLFYDDHTHVRPFTVSGMRDLLLIAEVRGVEARLFYQLPVLWRHPWLIIFSRVLQLGGPVKKIYKNKFIRWSRELMVLGTGTKAA